MLNRANIFARMQAIATSAIPSSTPDIGKWDTRSGNLAKGTFRDRDSGGVFRSKESVRSVHGRIVRFYVPCPANSWLRPEVSRVMTD